MINITKITLEQFSNGNEEYSKEIDTFISHFGNEWKVDIESALKVVKDFYWPRLAKRILNGKYYDKFEKEHNLIFRSYIDDLNYAKQSYDLLNDKVYPHHKKSLLAGNFHMYNSCFLFVKYFIRQNENLELN